MRAGTAPGKKGTLPYQGKGQSLLNVEDANLLIVDVQGKLANLMHEKHRLFENLQTLIQGSQVLGVPLLWVEQNPVGLGPTIPEIAELISDAEPISKMSFNSCRNKRFVQALKKLNRKQVLIAGLGPDGNDVRRIFQQED